MQSKFHCLSLAFCFVIELFSCKNASNKIYLIYAVLATFLKTEIFSLRDNSTTFVFFILFFISRKISYSGVNRVLQAFPYCYRIDDI